MGGGDVHKGVGDAERDDDAAGPDVVGRELGGPLRPPILEVVQETDDAGSVSADPQRWRGVDLQLADEGGGDDDADDLVRRVEAARLRRQYPTTREAEHPELTLL